MYTLLFSPISHWRSSFYPWIKLSNEQKVPWFWIIVSSIPRNEMMTSTDMWWRGEGQVWYPGEGKKGWKWPECKLFPEEATTASVLKQAGAHRWTTSGGWIKQQTAKDGVVEDTGEEEEEKDKSGWSWKRKNAAWLSEVVMRWWLDSYS